MYGNRGGGALAALMAFVFGGLVGAAIGILFAPMSGKDTRDQLKHRADDMMDQGREMYDVQRKRVLEAVETGKQSAAEKSEEVHARIEDARVRLKDGVDNVADFAEDKLESVKESAAKPSKAGDGSTAKA